MSGDGEYGSQENIDTDESGDSLGEGFFICWIMLQQVKFFRLAIAKKKKKKEKKKKHMDSIYLLYSLMKLSNFSK